ncbi:MAG: hypothetical protein WBD10_05955 [Acidobacteriaceae bacterium]
MSKLFLVMALLSGIAAAQTAGFNAVNAFPLRQSGLSIHRHVQAGAPFTVAGTRGVVLGQQQGTFEAWVLPVKLLSHFRISARLKDYPVPIDLNREAAEISVFPDHTVITYSHIAFTVRQIMFSPDDAPAGTGPVVLFQIDSTRPLDLTFSFRPEMRSMWPKPTQGTPSGEWVKEGSGGFYLLHTDFPDLAGAVAMPGTEPGIMAPYQEKPHFYPLQLKLHYDPARDGSRYFPLLMAVGRSEQTATHAALEADLERLDAKLPQIYAAHAEQYQRMADNLTAIHTPDTALNDDLAWAEFSIEQLKARSLPTHETALVAGYLSSGDTARPGFGWFFGRDALYTLSAVDSFGDFGLSREELEFLIQHQRDDGKIMHEYSQTAAFVDWKSLPYMYAAADSTPLFLMAMRDYVRASGDVAFLRSHREAVEKAWRFETTHDSDGDGIYDNSQGTGWVESWPGGMPHQEIYLAELDRQASSAVAQLEAWLGDAAESHSAADRADAITGKIEAEYYEPARKQYAFSRNPDGTLDSTNTMFPMIAWWDSEDGLAHADASFRRWSSHDFDTDWGLRDIAESDHNFDPISYHQGSVWPLFTGWASIAEYRAGHPLAGYADLMQNAAQTTTQDLGAVTELLSGVFFQPMGRSTSHQLWSSAMVVTPLLRGLFGIQPNAATHTLYVRPQLPADWDSAEVSRIHVGDSVCSVRFARREQSLIATITTLTGASVRLVTKASGARVARDGASIALSLPPVEVAMPRSLPLPGARTTQVKVLNEVQTPHSLTLDMEGAAGSSVVLQLRRNGLKGVIHVVGAELAPEATGIGLQSVRVEFPAGSGYQQKTVFIKW